MVLLSAAIVTKSGKPLVARQFMEISRSRIEGLLAAFPKLIEAGTEHTIISTDSVKYVYQPLESLYMVLITTKLSNVLEDVATLRLFARVVPEYCRSLTEADVCANAFELLFAFDEIIALGYRESVNLSQIRTNVIMDSHDENIAKMVQKNKEKEAKEAAKRRARELQMQRKEQARMGGGSSFAGGFGSGGHGGGGMGGMGGGFGSGGPAPSYQPAPTPVAAPAPAKQAPRKAGRGMKLGGKAKTNDFVEALMAEGERVAPENEPAAAMAQTHHQSSSSSLPVTDHESVHLRVEEKIVLEANRDGGLEQMEVKGIMQLVVSDPNVSKIKISLTRDAGDKNVAFQTHPNVDKKLFNNDSIIGLKNPDRGFPVGTEVGVVKWRFQSSDESDIPLLINCWPTINPDGTADVNIDYELQDTDMELRDVVISIPLPSGSGSPKVASVEGDYHHDSRNGTLDWRIATIDKDNAEGAMEFSVNAHAADEFFPVSLGFVSTKTFGGVGIGSVLSTENDEAVVFSSEITFSPDRYEIV